MNDTNDNSDRREMLDYDLVIVGAGPAGLATAIKAKQLDPNISVVLVEKGSEVGAHILSGAVVDPVGLDALLPDWREDPQRPLQTPVAKDVFMLLGEKTSFRLPNFLMPRLMSNHGNFVGSLEDVVRYMASQAEILGVEIYPGFAAAEILYDRDNRVVGVATGDMGIAKDGSRKSNFTRGMELRGKYTIFAEGARGSLSRQLIDRFHLSANSEPQKFGIGLKEIWQVDPQKHHPGLIQHSFGWPLDNRTGGGSFLYHFGNNLVSIGFVVHLNYENPYLSPFDEFQRFKTHPAIKPILESGKRISYGARAITEGGYQSVPKLAFPGGALVGCAAGFVNVPRIKGSHNAILSGMLCAEHAVSAVTSGRSQDELIEYDRSWRSSRIGKDLKIVRNVKPLWSRFGTRMGIILGGLDMLLQEIVGISPFGTLRHGKADFETLKPISQFSPVLYPKPDGVVTFDKMSSVFLSNTNHEEDQPSHLRLQDPDMPIQENLPIYGEPARLYCPAGVYEVVYLDESIKSNPRFVVNAQNCVHCKTCDIKDPAQNIVWVPPEGGGGPNYVSM